MNVATARITFRLPASHSLKDKRRVVKSICQRTQNRFQCLHRRNRFPTISGRPHRLASPAYPTSGRHAARMLDTVIAFIESDRPDAEAHRLRSRDHLAKRMDTADFLRHIQSLQWYDDQLVHLEQVPTRDPQFDDLDPPLDPRIRARLDSIGVSDLYSHQVAAIRALRDGKNVIVATPAASGKSMCYIIPTLEALTQDRSARALYSSIPTKTLAQDQHTRSSTTSCLTVEDPPTPSTTAIPPARTGHRFVDPHASSYPTRICSTLASCPTTRSWYRTLRGLKYIVLDEAHVYAASSGPT